MTTEKTVMLTAAVVREQEDVLTLKLHDGFAAQEVTAHRASVVDGSDDFVRLTRLMAAKMVERLREHGPTQRQWLQQTPNDLLERLEQEVAGLRAAIKRQPDRVLACAADVCVAAMMLADKADKLEPMPELIDVE